MKYTMDVNRKHCIQVLLFWNKVYILYYLWDFKEQYIIHSYSYTIIQNGILLSLNNSEVLKMTNQKIINVLVWIAIAI